MGPRWQDRLRDRHHMGISERTVNVHLNQVTNNTDSKNRNQTSEKSISSGIIVPSLADVTITNLRLL